MAPITVSAPPHVVDDAIVLAAIVELSARWHRCADEMTTPFAGFHFGRRAGYEQALSLLLGRRVSEIRAALTEGDL